MERLRQDLACALPGQDPVGRRMFRPQNPDDLTSPGPNQKWVTVVGIVGETKMAGLVTNEEDRIGYVLLSDGAGGHAFADADGENLERSTLDRPDGAPRAHGPRSGTAAVQRPDDE